MSQKKTMNDKLQEALEILTEEECPHNRCGYCRLTGRSCHIADNVSSAQTLSDLDCPQYTEDYLPPNWELQDLLTYAEWYAAN